MTIPTGRTGQHGFTLVELLVTIAVIGLLMGLLLPTLSGVKERAGMTRCASNLRQLGVATINYLAVNDDHLPQVVALNPLTDRHEVIGSLFGGKRGSLQMFGIDELGAADRPLNAFIGSGNYLSDDDGSAQNREHMPVFHCPLDAGQPAQPPFLPHITSMYDAVGTSYTLNGHALDGEDHGTLIPQQTIVGIDEKGDDITRPGGRMPVVNQPSKTWMIGPHPIYNYQQLANRRQYWHSSGIHVNLCFIDGHVDLGIDVPESTLGDDGFIVENTTRRYTFLPDADWLRRNFPLDEG